MVVHLYWNWRKGPKALDVTTGISVCGSKGIPRAELTVTPGDVTCSSCQSKAGDLPPAPVDRAPEPVVKVFDLSEALKGWDPGQVAKDNGFWKESYSGLGAGQLRMTVGNVLRGKIKKGQSIKIGDTVIQGEKS